MLHAGNSFFPTLVLDMTIGEEDTITYYRHVTERVSMWYHNGIYATYDDIMDCVVDKAHGYTPKAVFATFEDVLYRDAPEINRHVRRVRFNTTDAEIVCKSVTECMAIMVKIAHKYIEEVKSND